MRTHKNHQLPLFICASALLMTSYKVNADPKKVTHEMTEIYGAGAFLHAGSEMVKLLEK
jgi:hypothetical protein